MHAARVKIRPTTSVVMAERKYRRSFRNVIHCGGAGIRTNCCRWCTSLSKNRQRDGCNNATRRCRYKTVGAGERGGMEAGGETMMDPVGETKGTN